MNEHWVKYKDSILNLAVLPGFRITRWKQSRKGEGVMYTGDLEPDKSKPHILWAGHEAIDSFASKAEALEVAEKMIRGDYDVK